MNDIGLVSFEITFTICTRVSANRLGVCIVSCGFCLIHHGLTLSWVFYLAISRFSEACSDVFLQQRVYFVNVTSFVCRGQRCLATVNLPL